MPENKPAPDKERPDLSRYTSFILRCHVSRQGKIRCRLVEVGSGISHPLTDLAALPGLVKKLVFKWELLPRGPDDHVQGEGRKDP